MNKQQAIDYLAKILKPDLLGLIVQAFDDAAQIAVAEAVKPYTRADGHLSYHQAQVHHQCPYCLLPGTPVHVDLDMDPDFERLTCPNEHSFFIERRTT